MLPQTEITSNTAKPVSRAFLLGCSDGEAGALCLPELFFVKREFALDYVEGHESAAGETMLSRQYKQLNGVQA